MNQPATSHKKNRASAIQQTHEELTAKLLQASAEYKAADEQNERYEEVKDFFEKLTESVPHPGVNLEEIDTRQNDREIDTSSDDFLSLVDSIREVGLLQRPLLTLGVSADKPFLCIAGARRITAFRALGFTTIPAELRYSISEREIRVARLSENVIRQDLQPIELAEAIHALKTDLDKDTSGLARILNKDRTYITQLLKIAEWPSDIKELIKKSKIKVGELTKIAKRKLSDEEVRKCIGSIIEGKSSSEMDEGRQAASAANRFVTKRNGYFEEKRIPEDVQLFIIKFLQDNNIRGWF
ncbi:MAG: ParB/RepB/Spo0J family partition protein [Pseudobdellovibrionaceae bacterium]|nr:ParB/RepB/Spo0J family partition protein [Pseudobdellovibrionaceae bacterium]